MIKIIFPCTHFVITYTEGYMTGLPDKLLTLFDMGEP